MTARLTAVFTLSIAACSSASRISAIPADSGIVDGPPGAEDAPSGTDAGSEGSPVVLGTMRLLELTGLVDPAGAMVTFLDAQAAFHASLSHDYDDRQAGVGCTADHYDAAAKPAPADADAGWLRMSGFTGGQLLDAGLAAQPIVCTRVSGYYRCAYPSGTVVSGAFFAADQSPLGSTPIEFAMNGGAAFGPRAIHATPIGKATTAEDLTAVHYSESADATFHVSCSDACALGSIAVDLTARQASSANAGWPYPSVGVVHCLLEPAPTISIPQAAIAAMFAGDTAVDSVVTSVALVPMAPATANDDKGNQLAAQVGRGVFGVAPR